MIPSSVPRPPNLLDQRFAPRLQLAHASPESAGPPFDPFALQCSLMLAGSDVYLSDLAPETLSHICERLRARHGLRMLAL